MKCPDAQPPPSEDDPLRLAIEVRTAAEFMRLPPAGQQDPIFGLKRSYLNLLILPCKENGYRPPVKSFVLRRSRGKKGVRLIEIASLREFIRKQIEAAPAPATPSGARNTGPRTGPVS